MSQLRGIKGEEAVKAFMKAGGIRKRGKGDHVNVKMPNGQIITIPSTKEIKKAGLSEEKFLKLL